MVKISLLPRNATPALTDKVPEVTSKTNHSVWSDILNLFFANVPSDSITDTMLDYPRWYQEIARTTLTGAADALSVANIPARKYLRFVIALIPTGGTISTDFTFNSDGAGNYVRRIASNQGADTSSTAQSSLILTGAAMQHVVLAVLDIVNIQAQEKVITGSSTQSGTAGAANAVTRNELAGKWANTTTQISRIDFANGGTGDYAIGSEVIVLGHD